MWRPTVLSMFLSLNALSILPVSKVILLTNTGLYKLANYCQKWGKKLMWIKKQCFTLRLMVLPSREIFVLDPVLSSRHYFFHGRQLFWPWTIIYKRHIYGLSCITWHNPVINNVITHPWILKIPYFHISVLFNAIHYNKSHC